MKPNSVWVVERNLGGNDWEPYLTYVHDTDAHHMLWDCEENRNLNGTAKFRLMKYEAQEG